MIQVSSGAGQAAFPGLSLYCATKWGIEGFFDSLAQEVAAFGIQTTLVEPGTIRTDFGASGVLSPELDAYREGPVGMLRKMATGGYPAPGDPAKMAKAIVDTFEAEVAPPRLALGPDVYGYIKAALTSRLDQLEAYKNLTSPTATTCRPVNIAVDALVEFTLEGGPIDPDPALRGGSPLHVCHARRASDAVRMEEPAACGDAIPVHGDGDSGDQER